MEKITFRASLYKMQRDYEDECKITFQVPASELEEVVKVPAQKELLIEILVKEK